MDDVACETEENKGIENEVDFSFFLLFSAVVVFFKMCLSVKVKVLGFFVYFLWEHLHIVESP